MEGSSVFWANELRRHPIYYLLVWQDVTSTNPSQHLLLNFQSTLPFSSGREAGPRVIFPFCQVRETEIINSSNSPLPWQPNQQRSMQTPPHLTKNKDKQPNKSSIQSAKGRNNLALHCSDNCGWKITYAYVLKGERKERETPSPSLSLFLPVHTRMRMLKYKF